VGREQVTERERGRKRERNRAREWARETERKKNGECYSTAPRARGGASQPGGRVPSVPRSGLHGGGVTGMGGRGAQQLTHQSSAVLCSVLPSLSPSAGKDGDTGKSVFVQSLHKYPLSRLCLRAEGNSTSEMIIGGSVLLGPLSLNVPINLACPALFCFH
jgi:hypothetical protein